MNESNSKEVMLQKIETGKGRGIQNEIRI